MALRNQPLLSSNRNIESLASEALWLWDVEIICSRIDSDHMDNHTQQEESSQFKGFRQRSTALDALWSPECLNDQVNPMDANPRHPLVWVVHSLPVS